MDHAKQLSLFSDIGFESRAPRGFPVGCPTLDVVTTWDSASKNLFIYRPPGQVVSKINQVSAPGEAAPEAVAVTWKPDGQFLAVGWSDGVVRLMGLENNKAAHHIPVCEGSETSITHIGWASSTITEKSKPASGRLAEGRLNDQLHHDEQLPANLPLQLTFLEIDTALPKISPLPANSAGADEDATVFTLRTGIEFLFQPLRPHEYDKVNVMVVGTSDGKLQLSIHDSFVIGTFQMPVVSHSKACQMVRHASHPDVSTHALVLAGKDDEPDELHLVPMDMPFISSSPINMSLLASKLTTLQKLLRYLKQTQLHMLVEWKNARELPTRFLRSVEGDLEKMQGGPRGIVAALYHMVVTGHAHGPVREWLVDSLGERAHKRWDKAVVSGLENIRNLVHENFLPALERCVIILSRLRGLAQFHDDRDDIGFSVTQIGRVLDIVGCLTLVGHKMLTQVMDELDNFAAFSVWLRFQIDRLATGAGEQLGEKEATMDNSKVLTYIEKHLTSSPLGVFFDNISREDCSADWDHCEDGPSLVQMLDRQLRRREEGQPSMKALPQVDFLVNYMTSWCNRIFGGIAESKKRSVRFGKPVRLSMGRPTSNVNVRVCKAEKGGVIYTALACEGDDTKVHILRAGIEIFNGISANQPVMSCCVNLGDRRLVDLKFLGDEKLIVLCSRPDHATLVILVPVQSSELPYAPWGEESPGSVGAVVSTRGFVEYLVPVQQTARPVRMEVHDRSDARGQIPERICLLGSNRTAWQTFSMPQADD